MGFGNLLQGHHTAMARLFLVLATQQFKIADYADVIWSIIIGALLIMLMTFLVGQFIELIDKYNRTKPIVWEENGRRLEIPADKWQQLPAAAARDIIRVMTRDRKDDSPAVVIEAVEEGQEVIDLPVIDKGHVLVVGPTDSGKTTAMRAIIKDRQNVVVIDPHNDQISWPSSAKVIGGGLNFEAIKSYLQSMDNEIVQRFNQRLQGKRSFESLTVVVDELPAIIAEIGKEFGAIWAKWIMQGRKVGLFVVMGSQSNRVAVLGIEGRGDILENFNYVITLGKKAQTTYKGLTDGMDRPAVIHSVDGIFPVIIPNIAASFSHVQPSYADADNLLESDKERIVTLYLSQPENNKNLAAIQREIFGGEGGNRFYKVKELLEERGLL